MEGLHGLLAAAAAVAVAAGLHGPVTAGAQVVPMEVAAQGIERVSRLGGRVRDASDGAPLVGARVSLTGQNGVHYSKADGVGSFEFLSVAPGLYVLRAEAVGFLPSERGLDPLKGGERRILVESDATRGGLDLALARAGVIAGRVTDERGTPIVGTSVYALTPEYIAGAQRLSLARGGQGVSDDEGRYRLFNLLPDTYYLVASSSPFSAGPVPRDQPIGVLPTFYPSSTDPGGAMRVEIDAGRMMSNADIVVRREPTYRVSGRILDPSGRAPSRRLIALFPGRDLVTPVSATTMSAADGTFVFDDIPAGTYVVHPDGGEADSVPVFVSEVVDVAEDVHGLMLTLTQGKTLKGTVAFDDEAETVTADAVMLTARPMDFVRTPSRGNRPGVRLKEDWSLEVGPIWGGFVIHVLQAPADWYLKTIDIDGVDYTHRVIDPEALLNEATVRVVLSRQPRGIAGEVQDGSGRPCPYCDVIAFSTDPARWEALSPFVRRVTTDEAGRYALRSLPLGDYHVVAVEAVAERRWSRRETLEQWRRVAKTVRVRDGQLLGVQLSMLRSSP